MIEKHKGKLKGVGKCVEEKKKSIMTSTTANQGTEVDAVKNYLQDIHTMHESHFSSLKTLVGVMNSNLSQAQKQECLISKLSVFLENCP